MWHRLQFIDAGTNTETIQVTAAMAALNPASAWALLKASPSPINLHQVLGRLRTASTEAALWRYGHGAAWFHEL